MWNFGSLLGLTLILQIVTGISLSFHYIPETKLAFNSTESIMRDENLGWILRYSHSNGAGIFFILVYLHIGRNLYYTSYNHPRILLWFAGIVIYLLMMATAFLGYVLVWGSMSLWGAIVITNFFTVIPWIGMDIVQFIWGGFSVDNPTLNRFYGIHFTLPFLIAFTVLVHLIGLHDHGSSNPIEVESYSDKVYFHPYFIYKDIITFYLLFLVLLVFVNFYPNVLGHSDNYIKANPLSTPTSIVPEFYFLPFYAILRSIPNKLLGVISMALAILLLFTLPYINNSVFKSTSVRPIEVFNYWYSIITVITLTIVGGLPVDYPYDIIGSFAATSYFSNFFINPLFAGYLESFLLTLA